MPAAVPRPKTQLAVLTDLQQAAHDGAGAQELTDDAHDHQDNGVAQALEDASRVEAAMVFL